MAGGECELRLVDDEDSGHAGDLDPRPLRRRSRPGGFLPRQRRGRRLILANDEPRLAT